jgi:hypothetical protein
VRKRNLEILSEARAQTAPGFLLFGNRRTMHATPKRLHHLSLAVVIAMFAAIPCSVPLPRCYFRQISRFRARFCRFCISRAPFTGIYREIRSDKNEWCPGAGHILRARAETRPDTDRRYPRTVMSGLDPGLDPRIQKTFGDRTT